ncbi:MAG TPA: sensor histidine kinase [Aromatoleum sp.]|uniref:sensor histidine kinase n=1 Tax=Aromatoleum sp. TaxID=2307007 RepID=UPI002B48B975|nr:sensor histidine kinase [Aromatoleum sp.]HJV27229.1 sensor histidine kinase [Aromatoleum sp.]
MKVPRLRARSLRARLLAGSLLWIAIALTLTGVVLGDLFRAHVTERFDTELSHHLDQLAANVDTTPPDAVVLRAELSDPRMRKPYSGLYWQVDVLGSSPEPARLRSRSLWDGRLIMPEDHPADGEVHRHPITGPDGAKLIAMERIVTLGEQAGRPVRLIVAANASDVSEPVREFVSLLAVSLGVLALGLVGSVAIQVTVGLDPLRRLRAALAEIGAGRSRRLEGEYPLEIAPLVHELNALLAHEAEIVSRARTQAGNLAHAVKTPLAVLGNAAAREEGPLAQLVSEQVATARRQVDYHLARARAAAAVQLPGLRTPLKPVVDGLVRVMRRVHADRALDIVIAACPPDSAFRGEEQDLHEMLGNLLDNACKWASRRVELAMTADADGLRIVIDDDGPGLSVDQREAVFARGVRADEQVPGSGLGLGIVRDLAQLYGGDVLLDQSPAGGLRAVLNLPAA